MTRRVVWIAGALMLWLPDAAFRDASGVRGYLFAAEMETAIDAPGLRESRLRVFATAPDRGR